MSCFEIIPRAVFEKTQFWGQKRMFPTFTLPLPLFFGHICPYSKVKCLFSLSFYGRPRKKRWLHFAIKMRPKYCTFSSFFVMFAQFLALKPPPTVSDCSYLDPFFCRSPNLCVIFRKLWVRLKQCWGAGGKKNTGILAPLPYEIKAENETLSAKKGVQIG